MKLNYEIPTTLRTFIYKARFVDIKSPELI